MTSFLPMTESLDSCQLCDSRELSRRYEPDICQCHACGVYFRNPRPDQGIVLSSYNEGATFRQWQHELGIRAHLWKKRCSLISAHRTSGSLLDIGTGDGYFLDFVKTSFDVEATEISESGIAFARMRGHSVHHGTIFDAEFDAKKYDVVSMWHVLEHVPMPGRVLERAKSLLKPDGFLFIAVPNETAPLFRARVSSGNVHPFGRLAHGQEIHLFHFTPRVLTGVLRTRFDLNIVSLGVDDVHVHERRKQLPCYYVNRLFSTLFNWHWDTAMVVVCTPAGTGGTTVRS